MATGDQTDLTTRLLSLLPTGWFPAVAPRLNAVLQGPALGFSAAYAMIAFVKAQTRVGTAGGAFLDLISQGYFAGDLPRLEFEDDSTYAQRILYNLTAPRGTRDGMVEMLEQLTGNTPAIFQPNRLADVGGLGTLSNPMAGGGDFYLSAGGPAPSFAPGAWGTLLLPCQVFIIVPPPSGEFAAFAGYAGLGAIASPSAGGGFGLGVLANPSAGGADLAWLNPDSVPGLITDDFIYQKIAEWMPVGYTAWVLISDILQG